MTSVYSGGLMYEYSLEDNDYGIVEIKSGKVEEQEEFDMFKAALKKYSMPTGDGGASKKSHSSDCPAKSSNWQVESNMIPEMPEEAQKYMDEGAGDGPGLDGSGSQTAGDSGTATASVSQGQASPTGSSTDSDDSDGDEDDAAMSLRAAGGAMAVTTFAMLGALLL